MKTVWGVLYIEDLKISFWISCWDDEPLIVPLAA
jgi:hypothetical protein